MRLNMEEHLGKKLGKWLHRGLYVLDSFLFCIIVSRLYLICKRVFLIAFHFILLCTLGRISETVETTNLLDELEALIL